MSVPNGGQSVEQIITNVANQLGIPPNVALAIANQESGLNPNSVGDNGSSFGLYQLHQGGELGSHTQAWADDPYNNAMTALQVVANVRKQNPSMSWGQVAAAAQRPANQGAYAQSIDSALGNKNVNYGSAGAQAIVASGAQTTAIDQNTLAQDFGYQAAFFNTDPSLKSWMNQALSGAFGDVTTSIGQSKALSALHETPWYSQHTDAQRTWLQLSADDPITAQRQLGDAMKQVQQTAAQQGVNLTSGQVTLIAYNSVMNGLTTQQLQDAVNAELQYKPGQSFGGAAGTTNDTLAKTAADYGVPVTSQSLGDWTVKIQQGLSTPEDFTNAMKQQASSLYPGVASAIQQGQTVAQFASPYIQQEANLLEVDPNTLDFTKDPLLKQALQYKDPKSPDVTPTVQPLYQFENAVKQDPRWLTTNNARDSAMSTATSILKSWGFEAQ